ARAGPGGNRHPRPPEGGRELGRVPRPRDPGRLRPRGAGLAGRHRRPERLPVRAAGLGGDRHHEPQPLQKPGHGHASQPRADGRRSRRAGGRLPRRPGPLPEGHALGPALPRRGTHRLPARRARHHPRPDRHPEVRQGMEARVRRIVAAAILFGCGAFPAAFATDLSHKEAQLWSRLRARIEAVDKGLDGVLGVYVKDVKTPATIEVRAAEPFPTASSIKLAILYELYRQADEGRVDLAEVTRPPLPRVGGEGVLRVLGGDVSLTWRDLAAIMMG